MAVEIITKEDLQAFRVELLADIKDLLSIEQKNENKEWLIARQSGGNKVNFL